MDEMHRQKVLIKNLDCWFSSYGKHCGSIVIDNENIDKNNITAMETTHHQRSIAVLIV